MTEVTKASFGATPDGRLVDVWTLRAGGYAAQVLTYGGILRSLTVPAPGGSRDIVLGCETLEDYEKQDKYLGALVGRVANRIGGGAFELNGKSYPLAANSGPNCLHGGVRGFNQAVWQAREVDGSLVLTHVSPDGDEGFPGTLEVRVTYSLTADGVLRLDYWAKSDADTLCNLTNHSYFNLNGGGDILGHRLTLNAERFCEGSPACLPTGRLADVSGTPFDFRAGRVLGEAMAEENAQTALFGGFDHNFVLSGSHAAEVYSPATGIVMDVCTTLPGVQLYTANSLDERAGKNGTRMGPHGALCLETQVFPDGMNHYGFPSPLLHPGEHLHTETVYAFSLR